MIFILPVEIFTLVARNECAPVIGVYLDQLFCCGCLILSLKERYNTIIYLLTKDTNSYRSHNLISGGISAGVAHHRDADGPREVANVHLCLFTLRHLECFIY